jgi:hypothetical protein
MMYLLIMLQEVFPGLPDRQGLLGLLDPKARQVL